MVDSTIKDYLEYMKTDSKAEVNNVEETIDNMLMRLDEYKGTLEMIASERIDIETSAKNILKLKTEIANLAYRIDAMEMFISRVHKDMNTLETQLIEAEQDYPDRSETSLKSLLKPIFSKISPELVNDYGSASGGMSSATVSSYEKVDIISTDELFNSSKNQEPGV